MTTDVHDVIDAPVELQRMSLVWACIVIAILAAAVQPFLPPRAHTDISPTEVQ